MNFRWLKFALQNTLRNRRRSLVTVSIAALGTAGILLAGGFALYTYESLAEAAARDTGHLVIGKPDQFVKDEETPLQHGLDNASEVRAKLGDSCGRRGAGHVMPSGSSGTGAPSSARMHGERVDPSAAIDGGASASAGEFEKHGGDCAGLWIQGVPLF